MTPIPYPSYKFPACDLITFGFKGQTNPTVQEQIAWCKENFDPDDWDIDPLNMSLLFRTHELFVWFVLQWDPQYIDK